jgi:phosphoglycerate kinase
MGNLEVEGSKPSCGTIFCWCFFWATLLCFCTTSISMNRSTAIRGEIMQLPFKTLDDVEYENKRVLLRVDINSSIDPDTKEILDASRIEAIGPTLKELSESKVVLMAHQGRPGSDDFIFLKPHTSIIKDLGFDAHFVNDIFGSTAKQAIKSVKTGEILVLQNVRMFEGELKKAPPEEVAKEPLVQELYPLFDLFVNDAFGAAHRSQASLVGFTTLLPSVAGRLFEKEVIALHEAASTEKRPWILVLGGSKVHDKIRTLEELLQLERADEALLGGLVGIVFLIADGQISRTHGALISDLESAVGNAKQVLDDYRDSIHLPRDAAVEKNDKRWECSLDEIDDYPFYDIGPETVEAFQPAIDDAEVVFANGPMGYFEKEPFARGTIDVLKSISEADCTSIVGGGHLGSLVRDLKFSDQINHISTGGGSTIRYITGKKLDVIAALEEAAARMK